MASTRNDQFTLSNDSGFRNRVRTSLVAACVAIYNEGWNVPFHKERQSLVVNVLNAPDSFTNLFADSVATDANIISDATQAGTVTLTTGNVAAQAALVTDAHIDSAVASQFNCFVRAPA
jgi:hypothetical protein